MNQFVEALKTMDQEEQQIITQKNLLIKKLRTLNDQLDSLRIKRSKMIAEASEVEKKSKIPRLVDNAQKRKERNEKDIFDSKKLKVTEDFLEVDKTELKNKDYIDMCFDKLANKAIRDIHEDRSSLCFLISQLKCDPDYQCLIDWGVSVIQNVNQNSVQNLPSQNLLPTNVMVDFAGQTSPERFNFARVSRENSFKENETPVKVQTALEVKRKLILSPDKLPCFKDRKMFWEGKAIDRKDPNVKGKSKKKKSLNTLVI